jgi:hypothetical protein
MPKAALSLVVNIQLHQAAARRQSFGELNRGSDEIVPLCADYEHRASLEYFVAHRHLRRFVRSR